MQLQHLNLKDLTFSKAETTSSTGTQLMGNQKMARVLLIPRKRDPNISYHEAWHGNRFSPPEYDLAEIGIIEDTEAYVRQAFRKKVGLMLKAGYGFIGENPETVAYIKKRFQQISSASGKNFDLLFRELASSFIKLSNAMLVKVRDRNLSGGKPRRRPGQESLLEPVAAYFVAAPETFEAQLKTGKIARWKQVVPGGYVKEKYFSPENVVHMVMDKKPGFIWGTPTLTPVKDDIRALRRIEENVEMLIYQNLFPLFQYTVGTEESPAQIYPDGTSEVDVVRSVVENLPSEGAIVTPERHKIEVLGSESQALRVESYLQHFRQRVISGLGVSEVDLGLGNTANRSTSDTMSRNLVDEVKSIQQEFECQFNEHILKELLLESSLGERALEPENMVFLRFKEIDLDAQIKLENHVSNMFNTNILTHAEARLRIGEDPMTDEQFQDTFLYKVELVKLQAQAEAKAAVAVTVAESRAANAVKNTDQPANQHGKKAGPTRPQNDRVLTLSDFVSASSSNVLTDFYDGAAGFIQDQVQKGENSPDWLSLIIEFGKETALKNFNEEIRLSVRKGIFDAKANPEKVASLKTHISLAEEEASKFLNKLSRQMARVLKQKLDKNTEVNDELLKEISEEIQALRFRARFIYDTELHKARQMGRVLGLKARGVKEAAVSVRDGGCEECKNNAGLTLQLAHVTLDSVPGSHHPLCRCEVDLEGLSKDV